MLKSHTGLLSSKGGVKVNKIMSILNKIIKFLIFLAAAVILCMAAFYLALPFFAQKLLPGALSEVIDGEDVLLKVRALNLNRLDLSGISIGDKENPLLTIDSVNCDYSLKGLLSREIEKVTVSGLTLRAAFSEKGLEIPSIKSDTETSSDPLLTLPMSVNRIEVLNSALILSWQDMSYHIPFSIRAVPVFYENSLIPSRYRALITLTPFNQKLDIVAEYDILQGDGNVLINTVKLDLGVLSHAFAQFTGQVVAGEISLSLAAEIKPDGINFLSLDIPALAIKQNGFETGFEKEGGGIFLQTQQQEQRVFIKGLAIKQPVSLLINTDSEGLRLDINDNGAGLSGNLLYNLEKGAFSQEIPVKLNRFPEGIITLNAAVQNEGIWEFKAATQKSELEHEIEIDGIKAGFLLNSIMVDAQGSDEGISADFNMEASSVKCRSSDIDALLSSVSYAGRVNMADEDGFALDSLLKLKGDSLRVDDFYATDFQAQIPVQHPVKETEKTAGGFISINRMIYADYNLGSFASEVFNRSYGITLKGSSKLVPKTAFDVSGDLSLGFEQGFSFRTDVKVSDIGKYFEADIESISRDFKGISLKGRLEAVVGLDFEKGILKGTMSAKAQGLDVVLTDEDIEIKEMEISLEFEDLLELRSKPAQRAVFSGLRVGEIRTAGGEALFAVESADSVFVEKASIGWAGGQLYTYAVRIIPGLWDIDLILFCDRLKLKEILNELQIAEADGQGTVSGRIPLSIRAGDINIHDGFLYSEPGQGGRLKIKDTESFGALDQSLQMSIAKDALKDFNYDWAKLTLNSSDDTLYMPFQVYGRPGSAMRYVYDKKLGLRKTEDSRVEAKFEGIQFDINFRLPLNQLLGFKKDVDNLMELK